MVLGWTLQSNKDDIYTHMEVRQGREQSAHADALEALAVDQVEARQLGQARHGGQARIRELWRF